MAGAHLDSHGTTQLSKSVSNWVSDCFISACLTNSSANQRNQLQTELEDKRRWDIPGVGGGCEKQNGDMKKKDLNTI